MLPRRCSLLLFLGVLVGGFSILPGWVAPPRNATADGSWQNHPALAAPDGQSHRGDKMVAAEISDPRVLAELIRRFHQTKPVRLTEQDGKTVVREAEDSEKRQKYFLRSDGLVVGWRDRRTGGDFEKRQEYFLRLLDYYWFSKPRLLGMTWAEVDHVFGPLGPVAKRADISVGRDTLCLWFKDGKCSGAYYAIGY